MAGKYKELAEVLKQECIAPDIYSMWLQTDKIAEQAVPGQFISVYSNDGSRLLPRPISLCEIDKDKKVFLIGGGIGIPPMVELSRQLPGEKIVIAGYRDDKLFLKEELERNAVFYAATEDGSVGTKGNVLDAIRENKLTADVIYACGPTPMLRALKAYAQEQDIECWISMEERMACGIGACLACVCQSKEVDDHSHVHNKRVCKDGPVFLATEVEL